MHLELPSEVKEADEALRHAASRYFQVMQNHAGGMGLPHFLKFLEGLFIASALEAAHNNRTQAALHLKVPVRTLHEKLKRYGLFKYRWSKKNASL